MQDDKTTRLREQLRDSLCSLTREFGSSFPVRPEKAAEHRILSESEFQKCYPELQTLCHYTDAAGLAGILKSGTFWATNAAFLNDPEEFLFAYRVFESMVRRGEHALDKRLAGAFMEGVHTSGHDNELDRIYLISFSAHRDDLSQFRAYSDNARGYALEFEPCKLIQALNDYIEHGSGEYLTLRKVRYGREDLAKFHKRAIDLLKSSIEELPYPRDSQEFLSAVRGFGFDLHNYLREAGVVFKQEGYKSEEEFRVVLDIHGLMSVLPCDLNERIAVRVRNALPVPYIPFQFLPSLQQDGSFFRRDSTAGLQRIVVGPGLDFDLAKTGLFYLLRENGLLEVDIQASKCSYRSW
ncbi:MAG: DUF2971 domain-containing protein [Candidatus Hydrogenedentes bacterium]|nr:DUF2971 domain-containing protein [Candidatus Hydrogenedentota bacterium]